MKTKDEALKQALEALEYSDNCLAEIAAAHGVSSKKAKEGGPAWRVRQAIAACREALAQKDEQASANDLREIILRREAVIKVLERDAQSAQGATHEQ